MTRTTRETTQEFFARFGSGDLAGAAELFAEPLDFHVDGSPLVPWLTKMPQTREDIVDFYTVMGQNTVAEQYSVDKIIVDGEDSVSIASFRLVANGTTIDSSYAMHMVVREGQIVRLRMFEDSLAFARAYGDAA